MKNIKELFKDRNKLSKVLFVAILVCAVVLMSDLAVYATQNSSNGYGYGTGGYGYGYGYWTEASPSVAITYNSSSVTAGNAITITATFGSAPSGTPQLRVVSSAETTSWESMTSSSATVFTYSYTTPSSVSSASITATVSIRTLAGSGYTPTPSTNTFTITRQGGGGGGGSSSSTSSSEASTTTTTTVSENGANVSQSNPDGGLLFIIVPKNTVVDDTTFDVAVHGSDFAAAGATAPSGSSGLTLVPGQLYTLNATNASGNAVTNLDNSITLNFYYNDDQLGDVAEESLQAFYYNEETGNWDALVTILNPDLNRITTKVPHLSTFAVMGTQSGDLPASVYRPKQSSTVVQENETEGLAHVSEILDRNPSGDEWSAVHFIAYGTTESTKLSVRDRKGVVGDYYDIYGKIPTTDEDWKDVALILTSHKPHQRNEDAEAQAIKDFEKIYKRLPDFENVHDEWATYYIGYNIRNKGRNLDSERFAIGAFKSIYGYNPVSSHDWSIMRAIAYSGAKR
jgi:hypothetical protein